MTADCVIVVIVALIIAVYWATVFVKICNKSLIIHFSVLNTFLSPVKVDKEKEINFLSQGS